MATKLPRFKMDAKGHSLDRLVGWHCAVPTLSKIGRRWWVEIVDQSEDGRFVLVTGNIMFGRRRWVAVADIQDAKPPKAMPANVRVSDGGPLTPESKQDANSPFAAGEQEQEGALSLVELERREAACRDAYLLSKTRDTTIIETMRAYIAAGYAVLAERERLSQRLATRGGRRIQLSAAR